MAIETAASVRIPKLTAKLMTICSGRYSYRQLRSCSTTGHAHCLILDYRQGLVKCFLFSGRWISRPDTQKPRRTSYLTPEKRTHFSQVSRNKTMSTLNRHQAWMCTNEDLSWPSILHLLRSFILSGHHAMLTCFSSCL